MVISCSIAKDAAKQREKTMNGKHKVIGIYFGSIQGSIAIMDIGSNIQSELLNVEEVCQRVPASQKACSVIRAKEGFVNYLYAMISLPVKTAFLKLEHIIATLFIVGHSLCCHGGAYYTYGDFKYCISTYDNTGAPVSAKVFTYVGSKTASEIIIPASIVYEYDTTEYYVDENNKSQSRTVHKAVDVPVIGGGDQLWISQVSYYQKNTTLRSLKIYGALDESPDCARCVNLTSVLLPDSITKMNLGFSGCSNLTGINLPKNLTVIGDEVFSECENLKEITLPENLTSIGCYAFNLCRKLKKITLPDKLASIAASTFRYCTALEKIDIPNNITYIGRSAFADCSALREISCPENILLGLSAFAWCISLEELSLPGGAIMETLDGRGGQFAWCTNLTSVVIEEGMEALSPGCFEGCCNLKTISIPSTLTNINVTSFMGCVSLENIDIASDNEIYTLRNGFILNKKTMVPIAGPGDRENVIVPDGVTDVWNSLYGSYGNSTYRKMKRLVLPETIEDLSSGAFHGAINLEALFFHGAPPNCDGDIRPIFEVKGGGYRRVLGVMGYYAPKYRDEWRQVIDEDGCWCGLKMEEGRPLYAVTYNVNGGNGAIDIQFGEFGGDSLLVNDGSTLRWENHTFLGWALAPDGEVVYKGSDIIAEPTDGDEVTLYAVWGHPALTLLPIDADWKTGSITLQCDDDDSTVSSHVYSLSYYDEESKLWCESDGENAKNVTIDADGYARLSDEGFTMRNNGIGTVKYRVVDENGRMAECVTRHRHGLFIGVDQYQDDWQDVTGHFDHYHLASTFSGSYKRYGGADGYVKVLHGSETTRDTILIQLEWIADNVAAPGDVFLFYYVGHGLDYLITCWNRDAVLYASELATRFKRFPSGAAVVAIFDSCHSAGLIDKQYDWDKDGNIGWIVASQTDQNAYCGQLKSVICDNGWLKGKADAIGSNVEADGNGYVTFAELALWGQEWMWNKKNYESEDSVYEYGQLMSFYNSLVLGNVVAGRVPENAVEDKKWIWLSRFRKAWIDSDGDVDKAETVTAANGCRTLGECYALGINPEDPNDDLKIADFKVEDGKPVITLNHTTDGSGNSFEPRIKTLGKQSLTDADWIDIADKDQSEYRFFKVTVDLP